MAEERTLARPYAAAVFELAQAEDRLADWEDALRTLAEIAVNPEVHELLGNPLIEDATLAQAIIEVAGDVLDAHGANLVRLLAENDRLILLPAIAELYAARCAAAENRVDAEVAAAGDIDETQQRKLTEALEQRLGCTVNLSVRKDPGLIAGAVVRAGDLVIDGSMRAHLARLNQALAH